MSAYSKSFHVNVVGSQHPCLPWDCRKSTEAASLSWLSSVPSSAFCSFLPRASEFFPVCFHHILSSLRVWLLAYVNTLRSVRLVSSFIISHFCQDLWVRFWTFSDIALTDLSNQVYKDQCHFQWLENQTTLSPQWQSHQEYDEWGHRVKTQSENTEWGHKQTMFHQQTFNGHKKYITQLFDLRLSPCFLNGVLAHLLIWDC